MHKATQAARPDWSIQEIARMAGTTSRTLRHYDDIGLLAPTRVGANGYRYYDADALVRLQRILLLRELGLSLAAIGDALDARTDPRGALGAHLAYLRGEQQRIERQIRSVQTTIRNLAEGTELMAQDMFDGFDHTHYKDEVEQRWGKQAYAAGDAWWRSLSAADKQEFGQRHLDIAADYGRAHAAGLDVADEQVQQIVQRHYDWITAGWQGKRPSAEAFTGLGQMYVDDPRFAANYDVHGEGTAAFVRDAMVVYAQRVL